MAEAITKLSNTMNVTDALSAVLADTYRLMLKSQIYHWNVTGPLFHAVHEMTEEQYTDMFGAIDVLAERIRALGKPATVTPADLTAAQGMSEPDAGLTGEKMVKDLMADHEILAQRMKDLIENTESAGDAATADIATERMAFHEKSAWMWRSLAA